MDARRLIPAGAVVTALLVVTAIAAHGRPLTVGRGDGPSATFFDYVATTLLLFAVAMAVVVALVLRGDRAGGGPPRRGPWHLLTTFVMLGSAVLLAEWLMHSKFEQRLKQLAQQHPQQGPQVPHARARPIPQELRNPHIQWTEIAIVVAIVAAVALYAYVNRARRKPLRPLARRRSAMSRALDESLDDLRNDPDIRRAIIAAYARMEHALGRAGLPRRQSETPFEYLARSLVELEAATGAAERLTDLFEQAKFSHHALAEPMRDEAIAALVAVRDDLARPAAEPVTA